MNSAGADDAFCWCWRYVSLVLIKRCAGADDTFPVVLMIRSAARNKPWNQGERRSTDFSKHPEYCIRYILKHALTAGECVHKIKHHILERNRNAKQNTFKFPCAS